MTDIAQRWMAHSTHASAVLGTLLDERYSCRAFTEDPVPEATIEAMFALAQRTPSWCNTQPWQVHLLSGEATKRFAVALSEHVETGTEHSDLPAPAGYTGDYATRRRDAGFALYESLGIDRGDRVRRQAQLLENFRFFGAPHSAIITTDRTIGVYGAVDCGAYLATLLLACQSLGVAAIPQAAIAMYSDFVRAKLQLADDRMVVCAVSFGFADTRHDVNAFRTTRADLGQVVQIVDAETLVGAPDTSLPDSTDEVRP